MGNEGSSCCACKKQPVVVDVRTADPESEPSTDGEEEEEAKGNDVRQLPAGGGRARRAGVAGASVDKTAAADYQKPVYQKTQASSAFITDVLRTNDKMKVLFGAVKDAALNDVVNAFFEKKVTKGQEIIRQGDVGDCLYIVASGTVDVFVARAGEQGRGNKVVALGTRALFGELALMYSSPRAATVVAASDEVVLWALEQEPFKMLLVQSSQNTYAMYEGWLSEVDIFKTLDPFELAKVSELMESNLFTDGEAIITQGEVGDRFFILEEGECAAFISGPSGEKQVKTYSKTGDYFGELALLNEEPRQATVRATGEGCMLASLSKEDFSNVLGPVKDILQKHADKYEKYAQLLK